MAIYIDNVRKSIKRLKKNDKDAWDKYKDIVRGSLKKNYDLNVKPGTLEKRIIHFVKGKETKNHYLECYLQAFDVLFYNGAAAAIQNKDMEKPRTWRELLITATDDLTLSPVVTVHLEHEEIILELKTMFYRSIEHCKHKNINKFSENIHNFNLFLSINKPNK
jgi:hypothetical protein